MVFSALYIQTVIGLYALNWISPFVLDKYNNKRWRIPKGQLKKDNPEMQTT